MRPQLLLIGIGEPYVGLRYHLHLADVFWLVGGVDQREPALPQLFPEGHFLFARLDRKSVV